MKTKVYFRVDALKTRGQGHLVRCLALAEILKVHFDCIFLSKIDFPQQAKLIEEKGFTRLALPTEYLNTDEAEFVKKNYLRGNEIVVLDAYYFDTDYQKTIRSAAGKLVCIDDIHDTFFVADAVINYSGGVCQKDYRCAAQTKLFLGLDYLILNHAFLKSPRRLTANLQINTTLICLGGEDPNNDTLKVVAKCNARPDVKAVKIVLGSGYRYEKELIEFCEESDLKVEMFRNLSSTEMLELMHSCDTAICSPSTVALEYLSVGGKLFLYQTADNQQYIFQYLLSQGLGFSFDESGQVDSERLAEALEKQSQIIDRKSPSRLLRLFQRLELELNCSFRPAASEDVHIYFEWTNEKTTRQQSFNSTPISFYHHYEWFISKLNSENSRLYVMECEGNPVGQIRFDIEKNKALISYSLANNYRGRGLGQLLLARGVKKINEDMPEVEFIEGYVKPENQASIKIFQKLGFVHEKETSSSMKFSHAV